MRFSFMHAMYLLLLSAALIMAQTASYSARTSGLGDPHLGNVNNVNLIEDVSDVVSFPATVNKHADKVSGFAGNALGRQNQTTGFAYGAKKVSDMLTFGFIFNSTTYTPGTGFSAASGDATTAGAALLSTSANAPTWGGGFDLPAPNDVGSVGHLVSGLALGGDKITIGLDLFREASNADWDIKDVVPVGAAVQHQNSVGFSKTGALGITAGVGLKLGEIDINGTFGVVNLSYSAENKVSGNLINAGVTTTYNTEVSNVDATKGSFMPIYARVKLPMGMHNFNVAASFEKSGYQFETKFNDGDDATAPLPSIKSDAVSNTYMALGISDDIAILENTRIIPSLSVYSNSTNTKPDVVANTNPENTTTTYALPVTSLGFEHTMKNVWKFDQVQIRAGGSKAVTWTSIEDKGTDAVSEISGPQTASAFAWNMGVGFLVSGFQVDMTVNPATLNGIYFISGNDAGNNGVGPRGANVTLTYNFGAAPAAPTP